MLEILHQDESLVAINKPNGLLVHRSPIANDVTEFAVQQLRDQIGQRVYPVHRLDRKTSGVLVFALDSDSDRMLQGQFAKREVVKQYLAIVRGWTQHAETIDYALRRDDGKLQEAVTHYQCLGQVELNVPFGKHPTSRYSLLSVTPETGRMHQIRKHLAHIFHPIIGDRAHGCNKQNRLFKERWSLNEMLLHAESLEFTHPGSHKRLTIKAGLHTPFLRMLTLLEMKFIANQDSQKSSTV